MYKKWGKRLIDVWLGLILLIIFIPAGLLIWLIALADTGWPGIFRQPRVGLGGKCFGLYKFKTLQGPILHGLPWTDLKNQQSTWIGNFLRFHCLDELPQILNVIFGQMSLVGPRPWQEKNFKLSKSAEANRQKRNSIKPGLTGLGQVHLCKTKNRDVSLVMQFDLLYLENISLSTDLYILFCTIKTVFCGH